MRNEKSLHMTLIFYNARDYGGGEHLSTKEGPAVS